MKGSISNLSPILQQHDQTLEGSFSAVWTATIATKSSFCRVFRDLQDLQSFAPLRSQNFNKHPTARIVWAGTTVQRPPQGASARKTYTPRRYPRPEIYGSGPEIPKKTYTPRRYPRPEIYGSGPEILKKTYTPRRYPRPEIYGSALDLNS